MSRFQKLSHVLWHCQYHIVWTPKYRLRVLKDQVSREVHNCINIFSSQLECEIVDRNIQSALTKNLKKSKDRLISNESLGYNSFLPSKRARTQPPFRGQKQNQVLRAWILYFLLDANLYSALLIKF